MIASIIVIDEQGSKNEIKIAKSKKISDLKEIIKDIYQMTKNEENEIYLLFEGVAIPDSTLILNLKTNQLTLKIENRKRSLFKGDSFGSTIAQNLEYEKNCKNDKKPDSENEIEITLKNIEKKALNIKAFPSTKIEELIMKVATFEKADPFLILISYHGSQLAQSNTLEFYEIKNSFILHYNIEKSDPVKVRFNHQGRIEKVKAPSTFEVQLLKDIISMIIKKNLGSFEIKYNGVLLQDEKRLAAAFPKNKEEEFIVEIVT